MKPAVLDIDRGYKAIFNKLTDLARRRSLDVGFFDDAEVARYAMINEFGSPPRGIPARPFMTRALEKNEDKYAAIATTSIVSRIPGGSVLMLRKIGKEAVEDMRREIIEFKKPANAPSTIRAKGKDDPLVESGRMIRAVNYRIVR